MNKKQSIFQLLGNPLVFLSILMIIITLLFIFLSPRLSSSIFPAKRAMLLNNFVNKTTSTKTIDSQRFWEFREFYSPGYSKVLNQGLSQSDIDQAIVKIGQKPSNITKYTNLFFSNHSTSIEGLTKEIKIKSVISIPNTSQILFEKNESVIYKIDGKTYIAFLKPISEMKKANGFFEYDKNPKMFEKNNWFNITVLDK